MNTLSLKRINILSVFKLKTLFANSYALTYFMLPIVLAVLMPIIYRVQSGGSDLPPKLMGITAQMASITNLGMVTLTLPILQMAEEKEKNTLRNLMVSSITPAEYLISSLVPTFLGSFLVQLSFLLMFKVHLTLIEFIQYVVISIGCILISCLLGLSLGLYAKDQMSASMLPVPASGIIIGASLFGGKVKVLSIAKEYIFANVATDGLTSLVMGKGMGLKIGSLVAIVIELILASLLVTFLYKKNGFESD